MIARPIGRAVILGAIVVIAGAGWAAYRFYQHGQWDLNGAHEQLLRRQQMPIDLLLDAWSRPLAVEVGVGPDGAYHYSVRSYGRDGRPGPCAVADKCTDLDADWIIRDGEWKSE